jgi:hypothetical protein
MPRRQPRCPPLPSALCNAAYSSPAGPARLTGLPLPYPAGALRPPPPSAP